MTAARARRSADVGGQRVSDARQAGLRGCELLEALEEMKAWLSSVLIRGNPLQLNPSPARITSPPCTQIQPTLARAQTLDHAFNHARRLDPPYGDQTSRDGSIPHRSADRRHERRQRLPSSQRYEAPMRLSLSSMGRH